MAMAVAMAIANAKTTEIGVSGGPTAGEYILRTSAIVATAAAAARTTQFNTTVPDTSGTGSKPPQTPITVYFTCLLLVTCLSGPYQKDQFATPANLALRQTQTPSDTVPCTK